MSLEYILRSINYTLKIKLCFHLKLIGFSRKLGIRINDEDLPRYDTHLYIKTMEIINYKSIGTVLYTVLRNH
jgi:hypothetical protein